MPKMSVSPTESRKSRTPYESPFSACARRSATTALLLCRQGAPGAGVGHVRDLVDRHVVEPAGDLFDLADVNEGLDHVVRPGIEAEVAARALELHLLQRGDELVLVLGVAVHRLE